MKKLHCILLLAFLLINIHSQTVDCIRYINSSYATPSSCLSSSTDNRPINATAYVKATKNTTWYGIDDWTPYIYRDGYLIRDLFAQQLNCFTAQPTKGTWISGRTYQFSVKCTMLVLKLIKGDLIYFDLFQVSSHKVAECSFFIPIPGFSTHEDVQINEQKMIDLQNQAQNLRKQRKLTNKNQKNIRIE